MAYDNTCKALAERYPEQIIHWLMPETSGSVQVLKTELNREPLRADSITLLQTNNAILHLEFQTLPDSEPPLPLRMLDYATTLKRLYGNPVQQIVIFLKETTADLAFTTCYQDNTTTHNYQVLRLWEHPPATLLAIPALLPFATLAQTQTPIELLQAVAERVATIEDIQERREIASFTEILAGLRFKKPLIYQLFREDIMQESVIYQDILQKGETKGAKKGIQQGKRQEAYALVVRLLTRKVGTLEPAVQKRIQRLSLVRLETLGEALLDFTTMTDVVTWLDQQARRKKAKSPIQP